MNDGAYISFSDTMRNAIAHCLDRAIFLIVLSATFLFPVIFTSATAEASSIKVVLYQLVLINCLAIWTLRCFFERKLTLPNRQAALGLALFLGANILSLLLSEYKASSIAELFRIFLLSCLSVFCAIGFSTTFRRALVSRFICIASFLVGMYAIAQKFGLDPIQWSMDPKQRAFSTLGNPNMLAGFCVAAFPVLVMSAFTASNIWARLALFVSSLVTIIALILTWGRGGIVGLGAALLVLSIMTWRFWPPIRNAKISYTAFAICVVISGALFAKMIVPRLGELTKIGTKVYGSHNVRLVLWEASWKIFLSHPIAGTGPGTYTIYFPEYREPEYEKSGVTHNTDHAHNEFLEILSDTGILGLGAFLFLLWSAWKFARIKISESKGKEAFLLIGILAGFVGLLVDNVFSVDMRWPDCGYYFWLYLGLLLGCQGEESRIIFDMPNWIARKTIAFIVISGVFILLAKVSNSMVLKVYESERAFMRGSRFNDQSMWLAAIKEYNLAINLNPSNVRAYYLMGYCYFEIKEYAKAEATYRDLQKLSPHFAQVHYNLAAAYLSTSQWEKAAAEYGIQKKLGGLPEGFRFEGLLDALKQKNIGDEDRYETTLRKLTEINPDDFLSHNMLGNFYFQKNAFLKARGHYEGALAAKPNYVPAMNNLAGIHFVAGEYEKARQLCIRITSIQPNEVVPWINLGKALFMLGRKEEARQIWYKASQMDPMNQEVKKYLGTIRPPDISPS